MKKDDLKYCTILKTNINVTNMQETIDFLVENLEELRGQYICVANVHTTVMSFKDAEYRKIQNSSAMTLPDGKPLSIISRKRGYYTAKRVPGPDLMPKIFEISKKKGYRHFFYGSTPETLQLLKEKTLERYNYLNVVGMYAPPFRSLTEEEDTKIISEINDKNPDFIWVALGAPKQERWMSEHKDRVSGVMLGVGAAFDFTAGTIKRAPKWMQELCLEWFHRILQDPIRLIPRYFSTNISFLWNTRKESREYKKKNKYKKIAMIGHKRIPSREGGVEIVVDELSTRLVKRGYVVDAYNRAGYHVSGKEFDKKRGKIYNGIRLITIPTFQSSNLNAIVYSCLATMRALFGKYGVIHYHAEGPCTMLDIPRIFGIRVVATIHGLDWQRSKWGGLATKVLKYGEKRAAKRADEIIVLSKNVQQYFWDTYARKTTYIPNGISKPELKKTNIIQKEYGLQRNDYILFLARLVPEKGVHYLIEAYNQLNTDKKLVIAGGSSHSSEYMEMITIQANQNKNIIMTGFVQGEELEELYSNAYLFVLPSDVEGMSISLLEAMSFGNCCVISDIPENIEVAGEMAIPFQKSNVEDLRDKIEMLLEKKDIVNNLKEKSSDFICQKYDWEDVVDMTIKVYNKGR